LRRVIWRCNGKYAVKGEKGCESNHIDDRVIYQAFIDAFNAVVENREYRWINDVEYAYGNNGRCIALLHVVICEESWEETSRTTGKTTSNSTRYVWISGKEITKTNVETRCLKIGRYRWKIENNFLVMKHQGYQYEHCFSYDWNAMVGFHHLMQIGRFINVLLAHSELLDKKVTMLGINGLLAFIFKVCTADVLDLKRIASIVNDTRYQWRLVS